MAKFSDNVVRKNLDIVYVAREEKDMESREEFNSLLWEFESELPKGLKLYSTPVRDVRIGESIFDKNYKFIAYRSE
jgi:hypothetical protein